MNPWKADTDNPGLCGWPARVKLIGGGQGIVRDFEFTAIDVNGNDSAMLLRLDERSDMLIVYRLSESSMFFRRIARLVDHRDGLEANRRHALSYQADLPHEQPQTTISLSGCAASELRLQCANDPASARALAVRFFCWFCNGGGIEMASRWEKSVLERVIEELDSLAVGGRGISDLGIEPRILNCRPELHSEPESKIFRELYQALRLSAEIDKRLAPGNDLVKNWVLVPDIYSPKLNRFIEVDEAQHFSLPRLTRIFENRSAPWAPIYSGYFWNTMHARLLANPRRDLDPPFRDEARAFRDEMRDRLPVLYGLRQTIRLDEFTLKACGLTQITDLIQELAISGN
jgi:hypothetical protein